MSTPGELQRAASTLKASAKKHSLIYWVFIARTRADSNRGERNLTLKTVERLAERLHVDVGRLIGR